MGRRRRHGALFQAVLAAIEDARYKRGKFENADDLDCYSAARALIGWRLEQLEQRILFSTPSISGPGLAVAGEAYSVNLNTNGDSVDHWSVAWGDGNTDPSDTGETAGHTFATSGNFTVTAG